MKTFQELGICDEILKAITELGYENPMPVQEQVIPHLLNEETDLVALAQTGTVKNCRVRAARYPAHRFISV